MSVRFNPVPCTDGVDRAFVRVEFPVTRGDVVSILTAWHARMAGPGDEDLTAVAVREIIRRDFQSYGLFDHDDGTIPTSADRAWAERHTVKVWPGPGAAVVPDCPHGCGTLNWVDDQWHCPGCGDEFAEPFTPDLTHST